MANWQEIANRAVLLTQWLFDMSSSAVLGSQLNRFKPLDILYNANKHNAQSRKREDSESRTWREGRSPYIPIIAPYIYYVPYSVTCYRPPSPPPQPSLDRRRHTTVEEHVANDSRSLVDFEWVTAQYNPLAHHPVGVDLVQRAYGQQLVRVYTRGRKTKVLAGSKETREAVLWFLAGEKLGGGGGRECDTM